VRAATGVDASMARAFEVFTADIGSWWDPDHHILRTELADMVFEPRVGATSTTAEKTEVNAVGRACSSTSRRTGW
jgi:hypothetical protein